MADLSGLKGELPLKEAYQDLIHPAAVEAGKTIALPFRVVNLLLAPLTKWVEHGEAKLDEISRLVSEEVKDIPEEKLTEPEPYVAVPAMQAITYSMDCDELKQMYAKLLAKSINVDEKNKVHPAYVEIIKQMSPLDAITLAFIQEDGRSEIALCNIRWQKKSREVWDGFKLFRSHERGLSLYSHLSLAFEEGYFVEDITVSLENLARLGLIEIHDDMQLDREYYMDFENSSAVMTFLEAKKNLPDSDENEVALLPAFAEITALGNAFSAICLNTTSRKDV